MAQRHATFQPRNDLLVRSFRGRRSCHPSPMAAQLRSTGETVALVSHVHEPAMRSYTDVTFALVGQ